MSDDDDDANETYEEGKQYHEIMRTPRVLRRLVAKIKVPRQRANFVGLVYESLRLVNQYSPFSPPWLRTELAVSLLCELDELDGLGSMFEQCVSDMMNLADSGSFSKIRSHVKTCPAICPCSFCC